MAKLGCLLMVGAIVALIVVVVIPVLPIDQLQNNEMIDRLMLPLLCQDGERIERELYSEPSFEGGTSFSMNVYCVRGERARDRRDVTGTWTIISMVGFTVPFLLGLFALIIGVNRNRGRSDRAVPITGGGFNYPQNPYQNPPNQSNPYQNPPYQQPPPQNTAGFGGTPSGGMRAGMSVSADAGNKSLADRLQEIQAAKDAGLITQDEFDQMRAEVLRKG